MSEAKQPKPFLKKGTRQYLSNATVRSLNQKPKIVDFGGEDELEPRTTITNSFKNDSQDIKVEIKVNNRPNPKKEVEVKNPAKENKNTNVDKFVSQSASQKKKVSVLEDYVTTKDNKRGSIGKQKQPVSTKASHHYEPKISMVGALKRQDETLQDDDDSEEIEQKRTTKPQSIHVASKNQVPSVPIANKKVINIDLEHNQQVNFNSDSDDQVPPSKAKSAKPQVFPKPIQKKSKWEEEQQDEKPTSEEQKGPSKILQKFYKKQPQASASNSKTVTNEKKPTVADISRQLKQQIFSELLAEKHSDFTKKLDQLHQSITKSKKERENLQQATKQLAKDRQEFQKQMQRRKKEFEEKINAENSKLTREKRYLKDQQTTGKLDWRIKNEVQELRTKLQQSQNEKKKLKASYNQQIDRLKKKLQEQQQQTEALKGQIRCIEMEKIELKAKSKPADKKSDSVKQNDPIVRYWQDAPNHSYVSNFHQENFTLISLDPEYYDFQALEYYNYYLSKRDEISELVSEEKDQNGSKIIRKYKNGKQEDEYIGKLVREVFPAPYKFSIIHHVNGDIKMVLPEGIHVYYDKKNQIVEWKINPDKVILNFQRLGQIELRHKNRRKGEVIEVYKGEEMSRAECGQTVRYRRNQTGHIIRVGN